MDTLIHPSGVRITIDRARCVCSETCTSMAPQTFETDDEGLVRLLDGGSDPELAVRSAAACCPVQAIRVETPGAS
jgi:ferredoxin